MASCLLLPDDLMQVRSRVSRARLAFTVVLNRSEIVFLIRVFKFNESELGERRAEPRSSRGEHAIELINAETRTDNEIFRVANAH